MKRQFLSLSLALAGSIGLLAQTKQLSLGVDLGLPLDPLSKEYTFIPGVSAGFELPLGTNMGLTVQAGYLMPQAKSDFSEVLSSSSLIPAQAGFKYYFQEQQKGFYGHAQIGIHAFSESFKAIGPFEARTASETNLSWAIGTGYQLDKLDIGVRYNMIIPGDDAEAEGEETEAKSYIGLRVAYLFALGAK